jgi:hypothetical protein
MAEVQVKSLTIRHEAIMDYLMVNPTVQLGVVAAHFKVSAAWLSVIVHSDAFQSKLREKSDEMFGATVIPLREKILGLAHVGVEKLGVALENASPVSDKQFIADTTDSILKNLGYSPKSAPSDSGNVNVQNNFISVGSDALASAREKMQNPTGRTPVLINEDEHASENTSPGEGVQTSRERGDGDILPNPSVLRPSSET